MNIILWLVLVVKKWIENIKFRFICLLFSRPFFFWLETKKMLFILPNTVYKNRTLEKNWNRKYFSSSLYELQDLRI